MTQVTSTLAPRRESPTCQQMDQKSTSDFGGRLARSALRIATTSIISCATAPAMGGKYPADAESHSHQAQDHSAHRALQSNLPHAPADVQEFVNFCERRLQDYRAGGFGGDVAGLAERHTDRGGEQRGSVVNSIAKE